MDGDDPGFGIYVHWPFCASKCPYCDFNSHVRQAVDHEAWCDALIRDLRVQAENIDHGPVSSVFFGGGTPSLMSPKTVGKILDTVNEIFSLEDEIEVTLEANPTSVEAEKFREFSAAGVSRVSMGVQALNDDDLRALGRMHSVQEALQAFDIARKYFDRVSFDLIYGRQKQSLDEWKVELNRALDLAVDHLSLYQLTIEPETRFGDMFAKGMLRDLPSQELGADLYEATQEICTAAGLPAYEVSNHARPGAECRHNLIYWRYGTYLGVGPGAHGRVSRNGQRFATVAERQPEAWTAQVSERGHGLIEETSLTAEDCANEYLLMGLRLVSGISLSRFRDISGQELDTPAISDLINQDFLYKSNTHLSVTDKGRPVLNALLREILV